MLLAIATQAQDTVHISEVSVVEKRIKSYGFKHSTIDKEEIKILFTNNLSEVLQQMGSLSIRSYGKGGLATSSIRGASAGNTQINWNGISLNSPMLGQFNLANIPSESLDNIELMQGGNSLVQNSAALGGTIMLKNTPKWNNKIKLSLTQKNGSLLENMSNLQFVFTQKDFQSQTNVNYNYLNNNELSSEFRFTNYQHSYLNQNFFWKKKKASITANFLANNNQQFFPGNIEKNEQAVDQLFLGNIKYKYFFSQASLNIQSGLFYNNYLYTNKIAEINSKNKIWSQQNRIDYTSQYGQNNSFSLGFTATNNFVYTNNYNTQPKEYYQSMYFAVNQNLFNVLQLYLNEKINLYNLKILPHQPTFGINWAMNASKTWHTKLSGAKNFRMPTLNDRYWLPGGNPDLKPEKGYSFELGQALEYKKGSIEITAFHSFLKNRIMWLPQTATIWQATNFDTVKTSGLEIEARYILLYKNWMWKNHITGTVLQSYSIQNNQKEKIPFVSPFKLSILSYIKYQKTSFSINYSHQSKRFINESSSLDALNLVNIHTAYLFAFNKLHFSLNLSLNNIFDEKKQTMPGYWNEPRNFNIGLRFNIRY